MLYRKTDLHDEFSDYRTLADHEIPTMAWEESKVTDSEEDVPHYRMDVLWWYLGQMKESGSQKKRFLWLSKVANIVLLIPHSNATAERTFSIIRANKTNARNRLQLDGTLTSALTVKMDRPDSKIHPCFKYEPSQEVLLKVPKVTKDYNREHSK